MRVKTLFVLILFFCTTTLIGKVTFSSTRAPNTYCVSGDSFRAHCDFAYDELDRSLDPSLVKPGSIIFVKTDFLGEFFQKIHPNISCKYIIITHNSDYPAPWNFKSYLDDEKIVAWFGQNVEFFHKKLHPIPIGIANKMWPHGREESIKKHMKLELEKKYFLYQNFSPETYPERSLVCKVFENAPFCHFSKVKNYDCYLEDLASSTFVLSPRGNGLDTHRLWEALYCGSIPVVKSYSLDPLFEGLPVLIINDWNEVTEEYLINKYKEMEKKEYCYEKLDINYWYKLIDSYKDFCR
jgi:hypothetical protein